MRTLLAALVACLVLTTMTTAQEQPSAADERTARLFELGMTVLEIAERTDGVLVFHHSGAAAPPPCPFPLG